MQIVNIKEGQVRKYKSETLIPAGEYLVIGRKIEEDAKRKIGAVPTDLNGFCWLAPWWPWTEQVITGRANRWQHEGAVTGQELDRLDSLIRTVGHTDHEGKFQPLRPWQKEYLIEVSKALRDGYAWKDLLIAPLGAGKALVGAVLLEAFGGLAIMPRHLKSTFEFECRKFGLSVPPITTPESAHKFSKSEYKCIVLDEALRVKNEDALRTRAIQGMMKNTPVCVAMTGTPMGAGRELDVLGIVQTAAYKCAPDRRAAPWLFGTNTRFEKLSERLGIDSDKSGVFWDGFDTEAINRFIAPYNHVVPDSAIASQLPEITYHRFLVPAPAGYSLFRKQVFTSGTSQKGLSQARQVTDGVYLNDEQKPVRLKKLHKIEWLLEFLTDNPDMPICIVANWQASQDLIVKSLREADISVTAVTNSEAGKVSDFLDGKSRVFVMSAGMVEGYNLQGRCSVLVFVSNSTNPALRKQAIGRVYRPGQANPVTIIDLVAAGTTDQILLDLLTEHASASQEFIKGQLLENLKGKKHGSIAHE